MSALIQGNGGICCSYLIILLLLLVLLDGIVGLVSWVIYRPKLPKISLTSVQVPKFNVTRNSTLTSEFIVKFLIVNQNEKLSFIYGNYLVKLLFFGIELAAGSIPGFLNQKDNGTIVTADLKGDDVALHYSNARRPRAAGNHAGHPGGDSCWSEDKVMEVSLAQSGGQLHGSNCSDFRVNNNSSAGSADSNSKCKFKLQDQESVDFSG